MKLSSFLGVACQKVGRFALRAAYLSVVLTAIGLIVTLIGFIIEMEDRQSERIFRAWEYVIQNELMMRQFENNKTDILPPNVNIAWALEYLNRDFKGAICGNWIVEISNTFTGNRGRRCILPKKKKSDFKHRFFRGANLRDTTLIKANFQKADFESAEFDKADLRGANFFKANLWGASLNNAKLHGAKLRNACLEKTKFIEAHLTGAKLTFSVAVKANFKAADLTRSKLRDADLSGSILRDVDFSHANLSGAKLVMADISGANFQKAKGLRRAQLLKACISKGQTAPRLPEGMKELDWSDRLCSSSKISLTKCPKHR